MVLSAGRDIPQQCWVAQAVEEEHVEAVFAVILKAVVGDVEQVDESLEHADVDFSEGCGEATGFEDVVGDVALVLLIGIGLRTATLPRMNWKIQSSSSCMTESLSRGSGAICLHTSSSGMGT